MLEDLRYALRALAKHRAVALVAVLSLGLGIGANTTIFTLVNAVLLRPLPVEDPGRLAAVNTVDSRNPGFVLCSYPNYKDYRDRNQVFSSLLLHTSITINLTGQGDPQLLMGQLVSGNFFSALGVNPAIGRGFLPEEDATPGAYPVAVLSYGLWRQQFGGDPRITSRTINLNGRAFQIVGVAPPGFHGLNELFAADVWVPMMMYPQIYPNAQMTPGQPDPSVTQSNIARNICNKSWSTDSVRPADSVTSKIKTQTMAAYGFTDAANHYELDHLISLQVGGCPDCVENLWPEAYGDRGHPMTQVERAAWNKQNPGSSAILPGSLEKDVVENHVHDEICFGIPNAKMSSYAKKYPPTVSVTLQRGQQILATEWYGCYVNIMNGNKPCE